MNAQSYRVGIDLSKIKDWHVGPAPGSGAYYSDYESEETAISALADQIKLDLQKWRIWDPKHGSGLPPAKKLIPDKKRRELIRAALLLAANDLEGC